jgi:di/tricarboxylate transporter
MTFPYNLLRSISRQRVGLFVGPTLFVSILLTTPFDLSSPANAALAGTLWIATWWVTEAIPIPVTSLLPIVVFPITDVVSVADATAPYADPVVFLLLGGVSHRTRDRTLGSSPADRSHSRGSGRRSV